MMSTQAAAEWPFFLTWTLAHVVGFAVVKRLADTRPVFALSAPANLAVRGAITGCSIGLAQWLALWSYVPWSSWWGLMTVLGYGIGFPVGELVQGDPGNRPPRAGVVKERVIGQVVFGALVGMAQGAVLLSYQPAAVVVGWILTSCIVLAGTDTLLKATIRAGMPVPVALILLGVIVGGGTGTVLTVLLR